ncbi:MAG: radical SAM protein, partial [Nitrososphaerales archaeon]
MEEKPTPRVIAWESTRACRFACVHCRADAQTEPNPRQLTTEEAYRLVDEIAEFSKPVFIISGGDPLLRKDIFDIAARADSRDLKVVMSPSGSRIMPQTVQKMKESGVKRVSISFDGSNPEVHDGFRKVDGSFEMITSTLEVLRDCGMPFQINTTVTQHN